MQSHESIRSAIRGRYARVAGGQPGDFGYATGAQGASALLYDLKLIRRAPPDLVGGFCGVGNPHLLGSLEPGQAILDVGCGGGFDLFVAAHRVGPRGRLVGLDLTPEMVGAAKARLERSDCPEVSVAVGRSEALPCSDRSFDRVLSNGVLNLSPDKVRTFSELFRVLRPDGLLLLADIVREGPEPDASGLPTGPEAWSG